MKSKVHKLAITVAASAAVASMAPSAAVATQYEYGVMYCVATVKDYGEGYLSVMIPPTEGYTDRDGHPMAVWNIGHVASGGVADSFYSEKGPGAFMVRNTGTLPAYVYVTAGDPHGMPRGSAEYYRVSEGATMWNDPKDLEIPLWMLGADIYCPISPCRPIYEHSNECGHLAVSTKATGKVPVWRPLCMMYFDPGSSSPSYDPVDEQSFAPWDNVYDADVPLAGLCGQFLAYMPAGETQLFDLKFWAPSLSYSEKVGFIVRVEASEFRRWNHDMVVQ